VTYDDLKALAVELKKAGIAPFSHAGKNIYLWPVWFFWAYGQTSGNKSVEKTFSTLAGDLKFTDPEVVAGLEVLYRFAQDGMFIDGVNALDSDGAWLAFSQGQAAFEHEHSWRLGLFRDNEYPELDLSLIAPVRVVDDANILRNLPGGTGDAVTIYSGIGSEREELAYQILDLFSSDEIVKQMNDVNRDPVSTNANVQASDDPLALKYAEECAPFQTTYLDWYWPPEITRSFQEQQQGLVAGTTTPDAAAQAIQDQLEELYQDGYEFAM
jgi:raffinose/stachyose/melibiose transport system substrate-binding protein